MSKLVGTHNNRFFLEKNLSWFNGLLTIFTIPKRFSGHTGIIQENAVRSWLAVTESDKIVLFGEEDSVGKVADKL